MAVFNELKRKLEKKEQSRTVTQVATFGIAGARVGRLFTAVAHCTKISDAHHQGQDPICKVGSLLTGMTPFHHTWPINGRKPQESCRVNLNPEMRMVTLPGEALTDMSNLTNQDDLI